MDEVCCPCNSGNLNDQPDSDSRSPNSKSSNGRDSHSLNACSEEGGERAEPTAPNNDNVVLLVEESPVARVNVNSTTRRGSCSICGVEALYTCPKCGKCTCSVSCIRAHKSLSSCTGLPDPAVKVELRDFTDHQLQRDFHFLEDCRRMLGNIERHAPAKPESPQIEGDNGTALMFRSARELQEAARSRGVICEIMSSGMRKRETNTSFYHRKENCIHWNCEFQFHKGEAVDFTLNVEWPLESDLLEHILPNAWRMSSPQRHTVESHTESLIEKEDRILSTPPRTGTAVPQWKEAAVTDAETQRRDLLTTFLTTHSKDIVLLYRAQRLGTERCYFELNLHSSLREALRQVSFVTEYPTFQVVGRRDLPLFHLAGDAEKAWTQTVFLKLFSSKAYPPGRRNAKRKRAGATENHAESVHKRSR